VTDRAIDRLGRQGS